MENKETVEFLLEENEICCPEVLDLFYTFSKLSDEYLINSEEYFDEDIEIEYDDMDINETIILVREFLNTIDKKYLEIFNNCLNDGTFDIFLPEDDLVERPKEAIATPKPQASLNIPISYSIEDGPIIIHEFFHYLNDIEEFSGIREIFTEMISIYFELRYYQFLIKKGYDENIIYKNIYERIDSSLESAYNLCVTSSILDIYHNTGDITLENIQFLDEKRNFYQENMEALIKYYNSEEFEEDIIEFSTDVSYVLGTLLTFFSLKQPEIYDIKMKYINENINNMTLKDVLNILDTKIEDYNIWIKESIEWLQKAQDGIYEQYNMHSRTYSK